MKIEEDDQNDFPEDVPFPVHFQRLNIEELKERFNEYLENNIEEQYLKNPEFYLSEDVNEKRFYLQIKDFPEKEEVEDFKSLSTTRMIPMLVKSIQELSTKNTALEAKVTALENA